MKKGTHGKNEESFKELSYAGQARTLNAQILGIKKGIKAHIRLGEKKGKDISEVKRKYKEQLLKIIKNLE